MEGGHAGPSPPSPGSSIARGTAAQTQVAEHTQCAVPGTPGGRGSATVNPTIAVTCPPSTVPCGCVRRACLAAAEHRPSDDGRHGDRTADVGTEDPTWPLRRGVGRATVRGSPLPQPVPDVRRQSRCHRQLLRFRVLHLSSLCSRQIPVPASRRTGGRLPAGGTGVGLHALFIRAHLSPSCRVLFISGVPLSGLFFSSSLFILLRESHEKSEELDVPSAPWWAGPPVARAPTPRAEAGVARARAAGGSQNTGPGSRGEARTWQRTQVRLATGSSLGGSRLGCAPG